MKSHGWAGLVLGVILVLLLLLVPARADFKVSSRWFDTLPEDDRYQLQTSLILTGHYEARADAEFGPRTYKAITDFQRSIGVPPTGVLTGKGVDLLTAKAGEIFARLGMDLVDDPRGRIALILPQALLTGSTERSRGTVYSSQDGRIRVETIRRPVGEESFVSLYRSLSANSPSQRVTYKFLGDDMLAVSGAKGSAHFYTLFYRGETDSVGFSVEWTRAEQDLGSMLAVFLASYSFPSAEPRGDGPGENSSPRNVAPPTPPPNQAKGLAYGSGFFVSPDGLIVTNHHVAGQCTAIEIPGYGEAKLVSGDADRDLAVLITTKRKPDRWASIRAGHPSLGEPVIMLGYPLPTLLNSSLNVSTGIVSAEAGVGGFLDQFSSNVGMQPGNSGGPILASNGQVIGVAVAKLNDRRVLAEAGTFAPNVGFAITSSSLLNFLSVFRLPPEQQAQPKTLQNAEAIISEARNYTVQVLCRQ